MRKHPSPARRRTGAITLLSALVFTSVGVSPAAAHRPAPLEYVALGDSYASGFGAGDYGAAGDVGTLPGYGAGCGQSPRGLPGLLDAKKKVELVGNATCAGALASFVPGGPVDLPEQIAILQGFQVLDEDTDLVTVSAGGNDAGFGEVIAKCTPSSGAPDDVAATEATCVQVVAEKLRLLPAIGASLNSLYEQVDAAAPGATVVVTGYPHLFSPEFGAPLPISPDAQRLINAATDILNGVIEASAKANGFVYVDTAKKFEGHGLGSPESWIKLSNPAQFDDLHPTAEGYKSGYFPAVRSSVNFAQLQK